MVNKIMRNAPCPCGSGKKYKSCCSRKERGQKFVAIPGAVEFPEEFVLREIRNSSEAFIAYYAAERERIVNPIHWIKGASLPAGINYRHTLLGDSVVRKEIEVIHVENVPATLDDAMYIAHELEQAVLNAEGFKSSGVKDFQHPYVSPSLNSMLNDPVVDSRLALYGFNLLDSYEVEVKETLRQLKKAPSPVEHLEKVHWIFNYVSKLLDWELVKNDVDKDDNKFALWFDKRHPDIAQEGKELFDLIVSTTYDTPDTQRLLFGKIIERYDLDEIVLMLD